MENANQIQANNLLEQQDSNKPIIPTRGTTYTAEKEAYFDTQFKYQDFEEKQMAARFKQWQSCKFIAYAAINSDFQAFDKNGHSFLFYNNTLRNRFDELFPWNFMIVDRQFMDANPELTHEYKWGKRYIYMVDTELYNSIVKQEHKPRSIQSKQYPGVRIFKDYTSLLEFMEERLGGHPIMIFGKEPWAKLRYFINQIQLIYSEDLPIYEDNDEHKFPMDKFQTFLGFSNIHKLEHQVKTVLNEDTTDQDIPDELPELFSNYIKYSYASKVRKQVEQKKAKQTILVESYSYITITQKNEKQTKKRK